MSAVAARFPSTGGAAPWAGVPRRAPVPANDNTHGHAANDNARPAWLTGATVRTPTAHRAEVAAAGTETRVVDARPTLVRLRRRPELTAALLRYTDLMRPHTGLGTAPEGETYTADLGADLLMECRPTTREIITAVAQPMPAPRPGAVVTMAGSLRFEVLDGVTTIRVGGLCFDGQLRLTAYADGAGRLRKPREIYRGRKGGAHAVRDPAAMRYLLPANDDTPIADGAAFLAGLVGPKGTTSASAYHGEDTAEAERPAERAEVRRRMTQAELDVLDLAATDATAEQIGLAAGYHGGTARRAGTRLVDVALRRFAEIIRE